MIANAHGRRIGVSPSITCFLAGVVAVAAMLVWPAALPAQTVVSDAAHQEFVFAYRLLQRGEDKLAAEAFDAYLGNFPRDEKRGDGLYYRAMLARKIGEPRQAARFLENVPPTRLVPDYFVDLLKAQVHSDLRQFDQAVEVLEGVNVERLPANVQASVLYLHGMAYRGLERLPAAAGKLAEAAAVESPLQGRALLDLGRVQALLHEPDEAVATLERAIALDVRQVTAEAARLAGDLSHRAGNHARAIEFYELVATRHTSSDQMAPAVLGMMWAHFESGQHNQLLQAFQQYQGHLRADQAAAGASQADLITAYYLAGAAQQALGRHQNARQFFEAIGEHARNLDIADKVLYRLAVSQFETGEHDAMRRTIASLSRRHPDSPHVADAQFLEALATSRSGTAAQGAAGLTRIVDQGAEHPYYAQALLHRARLYDQNDQLRGAAADYQRYVEAAAPAAGQDVPANYSEAALRLADLYYRMDQYGASARTTARLLALGRLDAAVEAEALYRQGLALIRTNDLEDAEEALTALLTRYPASRFASEAHYYRGLIRLAQHRPDEAMDDLSYTADSRDASRELRVNALRLTVLRQHEREELAQAARSARRLEELVGLEDLQPNESLLLGHHYIHAGQPRTALRYLERVLAREDARQDASAERVRAHATYLAAQALRDLDDLDAAIAAFQEVIRLGRGHVLEARMELARTLVQAGQFEEAIDEFTGLTRGEVEARTAAEAIYEIGHIHRRIARQRARASDPAAAAQAREEADRSFKRLILLFGQEELSPLPELGYLNLAELAAESGDHTAARDYYRELAENYPDGAFAVYARAMSDRTAQRALLQRLREQDLEPRLQERVDTAWRSLEGAQ